MDRSDERLLTPDDLAAIFGVTRRRIVEWQHEYAWPHVRVGRTIRFRPQDVEQIKAKHTVKPIKAAPSNGRTAKSAARKAS